MSTDWKKLHSVPRDWGRHQLQHILNADEGLKELNGGVIFSKYPSKALPLGAITLGHKGVSENAGLLCYNGDSHLLTVAPTRSGKGTTQIVPTLLTYGGSILVIDIKGENHAITARHRASFVDGAKVFKFAPYESQTMFYNPLDSIRQGKGVYGDCRFVAELMVPQQTYGDSFWNTEARNFLASILFYVKTTPTIKDDDRNMKSLLALTFNPAGIGDTLKEMMQENEQLELRQLAGVFSGYDEKVQTSVLASLNSELQAWFEPEIQHATSRSNFNFEMLKQDQHTPLTVYLCFPPEKLRSCRNVLRTLVGLATQNMTRTRKKPKQPVLFMLDEFPSLGFMPSILDGLAYLAGYGAQLWVFAQSMSQLRAIYGDAWQLFPNSAGVFSAFNVNDAETANYLSELLGQTTEYQQQYNAKEQIKIRAFSEWPDERKGISLSDAEYKEKNLEADGYKFSDEQAANRKKTFEKFVFEDRKRSRWTRDNVGPANLIRQLGDRFAIVQLTGEKPAIIRKVPYYNRPEFAGKFDKWED